MLAFLAGGVSVIISSKIVQFPYKYIGTLLGIISLANDTLLFNPKQAITIDLERMN